MRESVKCMFRILIVDDEEMILKGIRLMIEKKINLDFDVDVAVANNVEQARVILETFRPDLLLTDIRMPDLDGFELISYVQEKWMETSVVILTSHADFEYAQRAIRLNVKDFILKPINMNSLKEIIEKVWQEKKERANQLSKSVLKMVRDMMLYDLPARELDGDSELLGQMFPYTYFTVIVVSIPGGKLLEGLLKRRLQNHYDVCYCFFWQERSQLIAICNHQQNQHQVTSCSLKKEIQSTYHGDNMELAISISADSYKMLHSLYLNAVQKIFYIRNFGKNDSLSVLSLITYQDCVSVFLENDVIKVRKHLEKYLDKAKKLSGIHGIPEEIYSSFFYNIMLYLESNGIAVPEEWLGNVTPIKDFTELLSVMENRLIKLKESINCNFSYTEDWLIKKLLIYIRQHYREDISLEKLADYVGYNTSYISNVFKVKIGRSYLECIHSERLQAAKKLLLETDYIMEHIAAEVGYNSASQFARVFRKYEGMSPSEFRKGKY